jgi:ketosteroid isomerase-like protein
MAQPNTAASADRHISAADRLQVVDLVNRLNLAFDNWDLEAMINAFTEDATVDHPRGLIKGRDAIRRFNEAYYPLTVGVRRHCLNHVVDVNDDGTLTVTSYVMLVRVAPSSQADAVRNSNLTEDSSGLPAIFMHSIVHDRFRYEAEHGWRIESRRVEQTVVNASLRDSLTKAKE